MIVSLQNLIKIPRQIGELIPAAVFLTVWISPSFLRFMDDDIGNTLSMCMWLEFLMGHAATAFIVVAHVIEGKTSRVSTTVFFGLIYASIVIVMCFVIGSYYPLIQFGVVFYGRIHLARVGSKEDFKITHVLVTVSRVFLLLITAGIAAALPLPRFGATPDALPLNGEGRMIENPHMTMAWGFIYFVASWYIYNIFVPNTVPKLANKFTRRFRPPC